MKKIFSILLAAMILVLSLCGVIPSISAADDDWVLAPYAEYITHGDNTYYKLNTFFSLDYNLSHSIEELDFADEKTADIYAGSEITVFSGAEDVIVEVDIYDNGYYKDCYIYVEESHLQEYEEILNGTADEYLIYDFYGYASYVLSAEDYNNWINGKAVTMSASSIDNYDRFPVYAIDDMSLFESECGLLLYDMYLNKTYLIRYSDYDSSYFYSDGSIDTTTDKPLKVYTIEGGDVKDDLLTFLYTEPVDELDWLVAEEVGESVALVFCSIVFGVLPLAAFIFCVVMFFVVKDKKYIRPYAVIGVGSLLVILAFVSVLLVLI